MSSTIELTFSKTKDVSYTVFLSEPFSQDATTIKYPSTAHGFIVSSEGVVKIGEDVNHFQLFGKRSVQMSVDKSSSSFSLNGETYTAESFHWFRKDETECFAKLEQGIVSIDMATNGFFCINNKALYEFRNIKMNKPLEWKESNATFSTTPSIGTIKVSRSNFKTLYLNGNALTEGVHFHIKEKNIVLHPVMSATEHFYIEHTDGSYSDISLPAIALGKFYLPKVFSGQYNFTQHFRCKTIRNPDIQYENQKTSTVKITATRYLRTETTGRPANETIELSPMITWLGDLEMFIYEYRFEIVHPNQRTELNYGSLSVEGDNRSVVRVTMPGEPADLVKTDTTSSLQASFTEWHTKVVCQLSDGTTCESNVYRIQAPYTVSNEPLLRFDEGDVLGPFPSDSYYMVDGEILMASKKTEFFTATFDDNANLYLRLRHGIKSYGTYTAASGEWKVVPVKIKVKFNAIYIRNVFSFQKTEISMKDFGCYDAADTFSYTADGSEVKDGRYKLNMDKDLKVGQPIKEVKFQAKTSEGETFDFSARFVFEAYAKVSFILPGDENFSSPTQKRPSFNSRPTLDEPFYTYGSFVSQQGKHLFAYGNEVVNGGLDAKTYPVIIFNDAYTGLICVESATLPIKTMSLTSEFELKGVTEYVRLNNCNDVNFKNNTLRIPGNTGICFFRADETLYLVKNSLARAVSFAGLQSLSQPSSPRETEEAPTAPISQSTSNNTSTNNMMSARTVAPKAATIPPAKTPTAPQTSQLPQVVAQPQTRRLPVPIVLTGTAEVESNPARQIASKLAGSPYLSQAPAPKATAQTKPTATPFLATKPTAFTPQTRASPFVPAVAPKTITPKALPTETPITVSVPNPSRRTIVPSRKTRSRRLH